MVGCYFSSLPRAWVASSGCATVARRNGKLSSGPCEWPFWPGHGCFLQLDARNAQGRTHGHDGRHRASSLPCICADRALSRRAQLAVPLYPCLSKSPVVQIEAGLYRRQGKALTNFNRSLPPPQSDSAQQITRDPYNFDFLMLGPKAAHERDLEPGLLNHLRDFLLELGCRFCVPWESVPDSGGTRGRKVRRWCHPDMSSLKCMVK